MKFAFISRNKKVLDISFQTGRNQTLKVSSTQPVVSYGDISREHTQTQLRYDNIDKGSVLARAQLRPYLNRQGV